MNRSPSVKRLLLGCFLAMTIILIEVMCGVGIALTYDYCFPGKLKYESRATILIENKSLPAPIDRTVPLSDSDSFTIRHDKIIVGKEFINSVFESGTCQLPETFRDLNQSDSVQKALENLAVTPDREEPNLYFISFQADTPAESRVFVNSVVKTYQDFLGETYNSDEETEFKTIRVAADKSVKELSKLSREYDQILVEYADVIVVGATQERRQLKLEQMEKSHSNIQKRLAQLKADHKWIVEATDRKDDPLQLIAEARKRAKAANIVMTGSSNETIQSIAKEQLAKLEIKKQNLMQRFGAGHPEVKAVDRRIEFFKQQAKDDNSAKSDPDPQLIDKQLRGYRLQLDREIKLLGAELDDNRKQLSEIREKVARQQKARELLDAKENEIELTRATSRKLQAKLIRLEPGQLLGLDNQKSKKGFRFEVLARAEDGVVVRRSKYWLVGIGGFLGMLVGIATVFGFLAVRSRFQ